MAASERTIKLQGEPAEALQGCAVALTRAGFKIVAANEGAMLLTAEKKAFGQWTKSQVTVALRTEGGETVATVVAQASAQSLSSLASNPAERLVDAAAKAIAAN